MLEILAILIVIKTTIKIALSGIYGLNLGRTLATTYLTSTIVFPTLNTCLSYIIGILKLNTNAYYSEVQQLLEYNEIENITVYQYIDRVILPHYTITIIENVALLFIPIAIIMIVLYILWNEKTITNRKVSLVKCMTLYGTILLNSLYSYKLINATTVCIWLIAITIMLMMLWRTYEKGQDHSIKRI